MLRWRGAHKKYLHMAPAIGGIGVTQCRIAQRGANTSHIGAVAK
jgi:hypothetical protein